MAEQTQPTVQDVIAVAEFRSALRHFLRRSEKIARHSGLTPQRYTLLMMIKGAPDGSEQSTVTELAERLQLAQSTITELVRPAESAWRSTSAPSPTIVTGVPTGSSPPSSTAHASIETVPTARRGSPSTSTSVPVMSRRKPSA